MAVKKLPVVLLAAVPNPMAVKLRPVMLLMAAPAPIASQLSQPATVAMEDKTGPDN